MDRTGRNPWKFIAASVGFHLLVGGLFLSSLLKLRPPHHPVSVVQVSLVDSVESVLPAVRAPLPLKPRSKPSIPPRVQPEPSNPAGSEMTMVPPDDNGRGIFDPAIEPASQPPPDEVQLTSPGLPSGESIDARNERSPGDLSRSDELSRFLQDVRSRLEQAKRYPWLARIQGQEGTVRIEFMIDSSGEAREIRLLESSRSEILDREALDTVKRAGRFSGLPNMWNEKVRIDVPLVFQLKLP